MNSGRPKFLVAIVAWSLLVGGWRSALAQTPATAAPPKVAGEIQYVGPDTYLLLDSAGRPQPVLGMTYEEFVVAWKKLEHVDERAEQPRFTLDKLAITGTAREDRAEFEVELAVESHVAGVFKLPLGMMDALLLETPRLSTEGSTSGATQNEPLVAYDRQAGGYVVWISGVAGQRFQLSLKMLRPLVREGGESSFAVNLPRALASRVSLTVPNPNVDAATASSGILDRESITGGGTRLNVTGAAGDFRLNWRVATLGRPDLSTVLSATGAIAITIDGHSIRSDARLSVRSYGGAIDRFRVRLPPGAQLVRDQPHETGAAPPAYRLVFDDPPSSDTEAPQIVTVMLAEKQLGPIDVELSTEQPLGLSATERTVKLAGFEVLGAVRQFGDVAVAVADDWQLRWESGASVRQIGRAELPASIRDRQPSLAFQYDRQPWSMRAQLVMRPMMVHATPAYQLKLDEDEARLHLHLDYQVPGARAFEFRVDLAGWELTPEPIDSSGLVDRDRVLITRDGTLALPLAQASSRRAAVDLELRRPLDPAVKALALPLPAPIADTIAPAELNIVVDAAIELVPDSSSSRGISPRPIVRAMPNPPAPAGQQVFAFQAESPGAVFAADRTIRPGEINASVDTQLMVGVARLEATQTIAYRIKYRPATELAIEMPEGWAIAGDEIEIIPQVPGAEPIVVAATTAPALTDGPTRVSRVTLPQPCLGPLDVRVRYVIDEAKSPLMYGANRLTLPQPFGAHVSEMHVAVDAAAEIEVALDAAAGTGWQSRTATGDKVGLLLVASGAEHELPLVIEPARQNRPLAVRVERVWLQSWQAGSVIQDRAAIRFRADGDQVAVELPPLAADRDVEVLLDGTVASASQLEIGRLAVAIPQSHRGGELSAITHTLELRYRRPAPEGLVVRQSLTPPQLVGTSTLSDVYWQVALPGDRHVIHTPGQLIPVDPRQWLDVFLGRTPSRTQVELESWAGATNQLGPAPVQNIYLFSGLSPASSIELIAAPRWLIVLAASGLVLCVASLWIYLPVVRRGWIALAFAALIVGLAIAYPETALLLGQASVLGLVLATLALAVRHWTWNRKLPRAVISSNSTNIRPRTSIRSDSYLTPALGPSGLGTSTSGTPTTPLVTVPEGDR